MNSVNSLEPAIDPNNRISFLLDWELTMKCNLDCSYCGTDIYGGHNNSTQHPPLDQCLKTIDFMFEYVDRYMQKRPRGLRYVTLNVYGGEALHHPNIVEILKTVHERYAQYADQWHLTVTTTTNAVITNKNLKRILPWIHEFTVSYHTEATQKQKQQIKENLLAIKAAGNRLKCIVLMHTDENLFDDADQMVSWLKENQISLLPRQLDFKENGQTQFYNQQQVHWFQDLYQTRTHNSKITIPITQGSLTETGRSCCGGRQLCSDQQYKSRQAFVNNVFTDWYCSVNHFFLYIKQVNGEIFVNRDCKMDFAGNVGPIGNLNNVAPLLADFPATIQCKKPRCFCGLCAPKAADPDTYKTIMRKYEIPNSNLL